MGPEAHHNGYQELPAAFISNRYMGAEHPYNLLREDARFGFLVIFHTIILWAEPRFASKINSNPNNNPSCGARFAKWIRGNPNNLLQCWSKDCPQDSS